MSCRVMSCRVHKLMGCAAYDAMSTDHAISLVSSFGKTLKREEGAYLGSRIHDIAISGCT